ncbi:MAG: peptidoglycan DD-metalloendopeptidase family protein [Chloroflexota bacterium]|nr:peptidoglycan DD-metalloendopeptidase family protein [Chloroflexota bacterium]
MSSSTVYSSERDLASVELWERSLSRSQQRRAAARRNRREAKRRKATSSVLAAALAAGGPLVSLAAANPSQELANKGLSGLSPAERAIVLKSQQLLFKFGDRGHVVAEIQRALEVEADGLFGRQTQAAVLALQAERGLVRDGIVGYETWLALFDLGHTHAGTGHQHGQVFNFSVRSVSASERAQYPGAKAMLVVNDQRAAGGKRPGKAGRSEGGQAAAAASTGGAPAAAAASTGASQPVVYACGSGGLATPVNGVITSRFGEDRGTHSHSGLDIAAPTGTPVVAAACGLVSEAGWSDGGYGNLVCIGHTEAVATCYAHLSGVATAVGAYVEKGQVIGYVGSTGNSTGPHLHFEVRENGVPRDPEPYLDGSEQIPGEPAPPKQPASTGSAGATTTGAAAGSETGSAGATAGAQSGTDSQNSVTQVADTTQTARTNVTQSGNEVDQEVNTNVNNVNEVDVGEITTGEGDVEIGQRNETNVTAAQRAVTANVNNNQQSNSVRDIDVAQTADAEGGNGVQATNTASVAPQQSNDAISANANPPSNLTTQK